MCPTDALLGAAHRAGTHRAPLLTLPNGAVLIERGVGVGTQLRAERTLLRGRDGRGGATPVGNGGEAASRRPPMQVAPHGPFADGEATRDRSATAAALDRPHDAFT